MQPAQRPSWRSTATTLSAPAIFLFAGSLSFFEACFFSRSPGATGFRLLLRDGIVEGGRVKFRSRWWWVIVLLSWVFLIIGPVFGINQRGDTGD